MERGFLKHLYTHILAFEPIFFWMFLGHHHCPFAKRGFFWGWHWKFGIHGVTRHTKPIHINPLIQKVSEAPKAHFFCLSPYSFREKYDHPISFLTSAVSQKVRNSNKKTAGIRHFLEENTEVDEVGYSSGPAQPQMWLLRLDTRPLLQGGCGECAKTRWWFQRFLFSPNPWGDDRIWRASFFQMAWNHQLDKDFWKKGG